LWSVPHRQEVHQQHHRLQQEDQQLPQRLHQEHHWLQNYYSNGFIDEKAAPPPSYKLACELNVPPPSYFYASTCTQ